MTARTRRTFFPLALVLLVVLALPQRARALPALGGERPDVRLQDSWDRTTQLSHFRGMPTLLLYEDKGSTDENARLKAELAELARGGTYKRSVALVAIADVSGYDYWPVRGFVKDAIQDQSHKLGTVIYCDWDGGVRGALGLEKNRSNVVLYGRDGKVLFAGSGPLSDMSRGRLFELLREQLAS